MEYLFLIIGLLIGILGIIIQMWNNKWNVSKKDISPLYKPAIINSPHSYLKLLFLAYFLTIVGIILIFLYDTLVGIISLSIWIGSKILFFGIANLIFLFSSRKQKKSLRNNFKPYTSNITFQDENNKEKSLLKEKGFDLVKTGYEYEKNMDYDEALIYYNKAIEVCPYNPLAISFKANTIFKKGEISNAIEIIGLLSEYFEKAFLFTGTLCFEAFYIKAKILCEQQYYQEAIDSLFFIVFHKEVKDTIRSVDELLYKSYNLIGNCYMNLNKKSEADEAFKNAKGCEWNIMTSGKKD